MSAAEIIAHHAALLVLTEYPLARLYGWEPPAEDERAARLISREPPRAVPTSSARLRAVASGAVLTPTSTKRRPTREQVNAFVAAYAALVAEGITPRKFRALVRAHGVSNIWNAELTLRRHGAWRGKVPR